jgi:hypothetical protein
MADRSERPVHAPLTGGTGRMKLNRRFFCLPVLMVPFAAVAADPPLCDDPRVMANVRLVHSEIAASFGFQALQGIEPRETAVVERVPALENERNRRLLGGYPWSRSRFCVASLTLAGGGSDTVHYRLDGLKAGPEDRFAFNPCFESMVKHYAAQSGEAFSCAPYQRP